MGRTAIIVVAAGALICLAAVLRLGSVVAQPALQADLAAVRLAVVDWLGQPEPSDVPSELLQTLGVERVEFQHFDPGALVIIRSGEDGQPGIADWDDNANGIVDDRAELGASYSDDLCLVVTPDQVDSERPRLVLQKGAFVPTSRAEVEESDQQARAIVYGRSRGEGWSFVVELGKGQDGLEGQ